MVSSASEWVSESDIMKNLWFKFGHDMFTCFKMASPLSWDACFSATKFEVSAFEASEEDTHEQISACKHCARAGMQNVQVTVVHVCGPLKIVELEKA